MRVMVLVKATEESEKGTTPTAWSMEMLEAMGKFNHELEQAGVFIMADGLQPSSYGKRVQFDGTSRTIINGPFSETKELVAGFWIWEVKDMEEALHWVQRCPNPMPVPSIIEVRPFNDLSI